MLSSCWTVRVWQNTWTGGKLMCIAGRFPPASAALLQTALPAKNRHTLRASDHERRNPETYSSADVSHIALDQQWNEPFEWDDIVRECKTYEQQLHADEQIARDQS